MSTRTQTKHKLERQANRHRRVRAKIFGTASVPRLCVFRSNKHIIAQLLDDQKGITLVVCGDLKTNQKKAQKAEGLSGKKAAAFNVGMDIAKAAQDKKIKKIVFDRAGYRYHGRVKSLAEGARKGGLEF